MRRYIRDLQVIEVKDGRRVRFSVTYAEDDGTPVVTEKGWTIDMERVVRPPSTKTRFGKYYKLVDASVDHIERLTKALADMPEVIEILGPVVERDSRVTTEGSEVLNVEREI